MGCGLMWCGPVGIFINKNIEIGDVNMSFVEFTDTALSYIFAVVTWLCLAFLFYLGMRIVYYLVRSQTNGKRNRR